MPELWQQKPEKTPLVTLLSFRDEQRANARTRGIADRLGLEIFHREIVKEIAEGVKISTEVIDRIEKDRMSGIEGFLSSLLEDQYLWHGFYLEHLTKIVKTIQKHGNAVIVGRGANFILSSEKKLGIRVVAPLEMRVQNISRTFGVSLKEAERRSALSFVNSFSI